MARLGAIASTLLAVLLIALLGFIAWQWYDSRLPGSYNAMDYAVPDYGGGPAASHGGMSGRTIDQLTEKPAPADFKTTLTAQRARVRLDSGKEIDALTFNGAVPGPELTVRQGDLVEVTLRNEDVSGGVSIHWHGVDVPNHEDGVAGLTQDAVEPGESHTYRFRAEQVGTFWYHSHQDAEHQVARGLYGAFVIRPRDPDPETVEITVLAHSFGGTGVLGTNDQEERPVMRSGTRVRVRLVNTDSFGRRFRLTGAPFRVVAIDGTDVSAPDEIRDQELEVGAGGRYDIAFTMPRTPVRLETARSTSSILFVPPAGGAAPVSRKTPVLDPYAYGSGEWTGYGPATHFDRTFEVNVGQKLGFLDGKPGRHWAINGHLYPEVPMYVVREGELIRMHIENDSGADHPMHLHGHHFLVLTRDGEPVSGSPLRLDTLNVHPHEEFEVAFEADNPGLWMLHCHNLGHAAGGLTTHLAYEGVTTPYRAGDAAGNHPE